MGGVYALAIIGFVIIMSMRPKQDQGRTDTSLKVLTDAEIEDSLHAPLARGTNENLAAEELRKAQAAFDRRNYKLGYLQKCVKSFKLALAYLNKQDFETAEDTARFQAASEDFAGLVKATYREAWLRETARTWLPANQEWEKLRSILSDDDGGWNTAAYKALVDNVMRHAAYTRAYVTRR
jgi:hypothetical protein